MEPGLPLSGVESEAEFAKPSDNLTSHLQAIAGKTDAEMSTSSALNGGARAHSSFATHRRPMDVVRCPHTAFSVPEVGLEPTHLSIPHFECGASANSATRASTEAVRNITRAAYA